MGPDPKTQATRRDILERFCENVAEGSTVPDGDKPFAEMLPRHVRKRRDAIADRPEAASGMVKVLRQVFKYVMRYDLMDRNPADGIELLMSGSDGDHSWTLAEIEEHETKHPLGSTARLALAPALYTGQRRADLVQLGKQHVRDGWLIFTQTEGATATPSALNCRSSRLFKPCWTPARRAIWPSLSRPMANPSRTPDSATDAANGATRQGCPNAAFTGFGKPPLPALPDWVAASVKSWRSRAT